MTAQATAARGSDAPAQLLRSRTLLDPALRAAVARLDEQTARVASYHLGWCDADGTPRPAPQGKALRPALTFLAGEAVGVPAERALCGAVAVELVHNFSLVHDDLMDRDAERRHRATVWAVWDDATAILVGDAMLSLAHEVLAESAEPGAPAAGRALAAATRELIRGQLLDVQFERRDDVGLEECLDMAAGKTGALLAASTELGALLGAAPPEVVAALRSYGAELGVAFQLVDDLLGIWGWPERTGKPVFSDLRSRKKTLPVVWSVCAGGTAGRALAEWLDGDDVSADGLAGAAALVEEAGGRAWAVAEARRRIARATDALEDARLDAVHRGRFADLARFAVERDL